MPGMRSQKGNKRMIVKVHEGKDGSVVCVVDNELAGKKFEERDFQLDLDSNFYKGDEKLPEEIGDLMRNAYGVNLIGERTVKLAVEEGIIEENMVKKIAGIPYYQRTIDIT